MKKLLFFIGLIFLGVNVRAQEKYLTINPQGHRGNVMAIDVDKNGNIVSGGYDKVIKIWNSKEGFLEREIFGQIGPGSEGMIYDLVLSPDNKYLAVSGWLGKNDGTEAIGDIRLYDYKTGKLIKLLQKHVDAPTDMEFFQSSKHLISYDQSGNVVFWDIEADKSYLLSSIPADVTDIEILGANFITTHRSGMIYKWEISNIDKPITSSKLLQKEDKPAMCLAASPLGDKFVVSSNNYLYFFNEKLKETYSFYHGDDPITKINFSADGKRIVVASTSQYLKSNLMGVYEERDGGWFALSTYRKHSDLVQCADFINNDVCVTAGGVENEIDIWKVETKKKQSTQLFHLIGVGAPIHSVGMNGDNISFANTWSKNDGFSDFLFTFNITNRNLRAYESADSCGYPEINHGEYSLSTNSSLTTLSIKKAGKVIGINTRNVETGAAHWVYTFIEDKFVVSGGGYGIVEAFTLDGKLVTTLVGHEGDMRGLGVSKDGKFLISGSQDQTIRIWRIPEIGTKDFIYPVVSLFIGKNAEWVIWNEEGYFTSSKKGASYVGYHINQGRDKEAKFYPFEQFDIKYNRPDIIIESLGLVDQAIIDLYKSAYLKRLKRMGIDEEDLKGDMNVPQLTIKQNSAEKQKASLTIKATDEKYGLRTLNVFVNDVPIYGRNGLRFDDENQKNFEKTISLDLMSGLNKIEVSVTNTAGVESLKETVNLNNTVDEASNLYIVSLGVSDYKDSAYNLDYAAKDAKDVNTLFTGSTYFKNVYSKLFVNGEVTKKSIVGLKDFLANASINDVVVFFVAGHGVLNKNLDYYYCTYDMDFYAPEKFGITYSELEVLFDGIKAIRKVLIMDTCHSGEVDKDDVEEIAFVNTENDDIQFRSTNTTTTLREVQGLKKTNEAVKEMFNDLRRGTGATVISSAGGAEYAMESDKWKNGLFTYCLLEGIQTMNADADKNGEILLSELQNYISQKVVEISNGRQMPTSRFENLSLDYRVW